LLSAHRKGADSLAASLYVPVTHFADPHPRHSGTGLICAIVLALLGVKDDIIAHEYNLTELGLASRKEEIVQQLINGKALFGDRPRAERMVSARYVATCEPGDGEAVVD
jgi:hypothetical protein